jgi:hypothetical protein
MTTEQLAAPTAATAAPTGMESAGDDGRVFASSEVPQAPQSESQKILADLVKYKAPQNVIDEFKQQNPDMADATMTPAEKEVAAEFPPVSAKDVDLQFPADVPMTPEITAIKTQMETWITASGGTKEMIQPLISAINATAPIAAMTADQRAVHMKVETDKIIRSVGGEANYKTQLAEAKIYLTELEARAPGIRKFIMDNPHIIDNSALVQSQLFRLAALAKARRGGK